MENKLSPREEAFVEYWEKNRLREKKLLNQLLIGLPLGILFGAPVLLNLFMGWYRRADMQANAKLNPVVLIVALLLITVFIAIFSRKHKWEMKEQQYLEFLAKKQRLENSALPSNENAAPPAANEEL